MTAPTTREVDPTAGGVPTLLKAALPSLPGVNALPGIRKASAKGFTGLAFSRPPVEVERAQVDAYARSAASRSRTSSRSPTRTCWRSRCRWRS